MPVYRPSGNPIAPKFDAAVARKIMIDVVSELSKSPDPNLQTGPVLNEVVNRLGIRLDLEGEQAVLTLWHDLFRSGQLSYGYNISNAHPPFCHVTALGRETLKHASRDPANADGYLEYLKQQGALDAIAHSYISEALSTYNSNCFKASAVMVGAATERIVLELRDNLVANMTRATLPIPPGLSDWRYKTVRDAITTELESKKSSMTPAIPEHRSH